MTAGTARTFVLEDAGTWPEHTMTRLLARHWPSIAAWHPPQTSAPDGRAALEYHMPELLDQYDALIDATGATSAQAAMLTGWCPPPLHGACTNAATTIGTPALARTYDYPPHGVAMTMLRTHWTGTPILGQADNVWGLVDGMTSSLAASITFGGRRAHGYGFGISTIIRYLLTVCHTTSEALDTLTRLPSAGAYNITLIDTHGISATAETSPDRPQRTLARPWAANRQHDTTEMPEHALASGTIEREHTLNARYQAGPVDASALNALMHAWPIQRHQPGTDWGTVYTATYDLAARTATLTWPAHTWTVPLDSTDSATGPTDPHLHLRHPAGAYI